MVTFKNVECEKRHDTDCRMPMASRALILYLSDLVIIHRIAIAAESRLLLSSRRLLIVSILRFLLPFPMLRQPVV
jgi:hypothetical protein